MVSFSTVSSSDTQVLILYARVILNLKILTLS